jgi:flavin-dependent dehydrogenase
MNEKFDVAVIGGGPSGTALAIALARTRRMVAVLERSYYDQVRIGETLPPRARLQLMTLGVWDRFLNDGHVPSPAILSAWGREELYENHFIFHPYGHGWHLDRRRFDAMLAGGAEEAGARVYRGARVTTCLPVASHGWQLEFTADGKQSRLQASFLVDATGRASTLARCQGTTRIFYDRLVGIVGFCSAHSHEGESDYQTLVEAVEDGWWYSAWLPHARLVVAYMTDADLIPDDPRRTDEHWQSRLEKAPHTRVRVGACLLEPGLRRVAANSYRRDRLTGAHWLAVGDAAAAYDPLSAQGIYHALESGLQAAAAIESCRLGDRTAMAEYALWSQRRFDEYLRLRTRYYDREKRWPDSEFWQRRQAAQSRGVEG